MSINVIHLGKTINEDYDKPITLSKDESEEYFPTLYLNNIEGLDGLEEGQEGVAVIAFRVKSKTVTDRTVNGKSKRDVSVDIEIRSFEPVSDEDVKTEKNESPKDGHINWAAAMEAARESIED